MSIQLRFTLLLGLLFGGFLATVLALRMFERAERAEMISMDREARSQYLNHWIDAVARELPQFATDLAESEEFAESLTSATGSLQEAIGNALRQANLNALWIVNPDASVRLQTSTTGINNSNTLPLDPGAFTRLIADTPNPRFFLETGGTLLELCIRKIQTTTENLWLVVAREWSDAQMAALSALTEGNVSLRPPHALSRPPENDGELALVRPLLDWNGRPVRTLHLAYATPEIERALRAGWQQTLLFIAFGLLVLGALSLALHAWVLRPLAHIRDSLANNDASPAAPIAREKTELGRVAELVLSSFAQREALQREVEERRRAEKALAQSEETLRENYEKRAQLGRDLHDGVIQSLYAAGMGLAGIRNQLHPDQTEAAARLEQTRGALNETIHDVRNFIVGLEPESLKLQTFSQAVAALVENMQNLRSFQAKLEMDDDLSNQLTMSQRVHALQIAREAVSNALRHGEAKNIGIALRRQRQFAEFEVIDDGRGFNPNTAASQGNGLENFAHRARELGGELVVDSHQGQGTRVKLSFSLNYD